MHAGDLLLGPTVKSFNEHLLALHKNRVSIVKSQMKDGEAAILGAISLIGEFGEKKQGTPQWRPGTSLGKETVTT